MPVLCRGPEAESESESPGVVGRSQNSEAVGRPHSSRRRSQSRLESCSNEPGVGVGVGVDREPGVGVGVGIAPALL